MTFATSSPVKSLLVLLCATGIGIACFIVHKAVERRLRIAPRPDKLLTTPFAYAAALILLGSSAWSVFLTIYWLRNGAGLGSFIPLINVAIIISYFFHREGKLIDRGM